MAVVSLREVAARLRALEAAREPAPLPVPALVARVAAPPAPASPAPEQDLDPAASVWPAGAGYWLTHDAVTLAGILNMGGTYRWCPSGDLDMWREDGRYVGFGPHKITALRAAGLLPQALKGETCVSAPGGVARDI
jgi:hypothetical protein